MQRLFSTFANGWPGLGLLLLRVLIAILLIRPGITILGIPTLSSAMVPHVIAACAGVLLFVGLWTPIVGALIAVAELWIALAGTADPLISIVIAALGAIMAMIGPGAWSIDARLFGRKQIKT